MQALFIIQVVLYAALGLAYGIRRLQTRLGYYTFLGALSLSLALANGLQLLKNDRVGEAVEIVLGVILLGYPLLINHLLRKWIMSMEDFISLKLQRRAMHSTLLALCFLPFATGLSILFGVIAMEQTIKGAGAVALRIVPAILIALLDIFMAAMCFLCYRGIPPTSDGSLDGKAAQVRRLIGYWLLLSITILLSSIIPESTIADPILDIILALALAILMLWPGALEGYSTSPECPYSEKGAPSHHVEYYQPPPPVRPRSPEAQIIA
ncbi:hypothetical protein BJ684DRAFT_19307 [Piptocephalis cylindrospora]|uniref:Uncharacterized protein n=1 Tax=Piptocephalis cylindrospora TaxID=1907219 RepID=A0A4P9Y5H0_9FUNG|nr:hypothetical protein BJ684DRAFT_19307 [Piptocephalis cylindrospora]|eukprot:RKP14268.1 hypothetical protein BJ684DRAFT_19307 [Piptocephalis cylindrospora]